MSSFTSPLIVRLGSGKSWWVYRRFTYRIGKKYSRRFVSIPTGFETDFASIPKFILPFLPDWSKFNKSSPIHDYLYRNRMIMGKPITRKRADKVFYEAMLIDFRHHKSGKLVAWLEYWAVRLFARMAWEKNPPSKPKTIHISKMGLITPEELTK